jgi:hypothetical protein
VECGRGVASRARSRRSAAQVPRPVVSAGMGIGDRKAMPVERPAARPLKWKWNQLYAWSGESGSGKLFSSGERRSSSSGTAISCSISAATVLPRALMSSARSNDRTNASSRHRRASAEDLAQAICLGASRPLHEQVANRPCKTHSFPRPPRQRLRTNPPIASASATLGSTQKFGAGALVDRVLRFIRQLFWPTSAEWQFFPATASSRIPPSPP